MALDKCNMHHKSMTAKSSPYVIFMLGRNICIWTRISCTHQSNYNASHT